jgi:hypothetical protein
MRQIPFRADRALVDQLAEVARAFGRSINSELAVAVEAHVHAAMLALVKDPSARSDPRVREMLEREPGLEQRISEKLARVHREAFDRKPPLGIFDVLGEPGVVPSDEKRKITDP